MCDLTTDLEKITAKVNEYKPNKICQLLPDFMLEVSSSHTSRLETPSDLHVRLCEDNALNMMGFND